MTAFPGATTTADGVAAMVGEQPVTIAEVNERHAALRRGPLASRLPAPGTAEGRNLIRWLVQAITTERVIEQEAAARGLPAPREAVAGHELTFMRALAAGGVVAAVVAASPLARALRREITAGVLMNEPEIRAYYDRNPDRFTVPEQRWVSRRGDGRWSSLGPVRRGELTGPLEDAIFSAAPGDIVGPIATPTGSWTLRVDRTDPGGPRPYQEVRETITSELATAATDREFASWLETRYAERVHLMPGFEHPADPRSPDTTHHH
jgi:[acyl-carrier-protein] S-malonyltransferase